MFVAAANARTVHVPDLEKVIAPVTEFTLQSELPPGTTEYAIVPSPVVLAREFGALGDEVNVVFVADQETTWAGSAVHWA